MATERIGEGFVEARLDTTRLKRDAADLERDLGQRFEQTGRRMQSAGRNMTRRLTAPIVAMGAAIVKVAQNFESSMNRVGALTGATGQEFDKLRDRAMELGRTTQFSASQAADGMGFLAQAGFEVNEIYEAMPGVLNLAASGQIELAEAADIASNILSGMNLEVSELDRVIDTMAATTSSSNTDMRQLGDAMVFVAPVAASAGVQFEEVAAAIGLLGDAGIQASMAGSSLRGAISRLLAPSDQVAGVLERLGVNATDASGELLPLHDIVRQLGDAGASTGDMMQIFGQRAGPAMAALVARGGDALQEFTADLEDSGGAAQRMADRQMEGLTGALARMRSAAEGAAIAIGDSGLVSMLANLAERVAGMFQNLAEANPALLRFGLLLAGVVAAAGPLTWLIGGMLRPFGQLLSVVSRAGGATALLAGAMNPLALGIGAAVLALGGLVWWLSRTDDAQQTTAETAGALAASLGIEYAEATAAVQELGEAAEGTAQDFVNANSEILSSLRDMSAEAAQATLFQIGYELVQGGASPEEAFEAIQRLADEAGIQLPVELTPPDLEDFNQLIEATQAKLAELSGAEAGPRDPFALGPIHDYQAELQEVGRQAALAFAEGNFTGAVEMMARAEQAAHDAELGFFGTRGAIQGMSEAFQDTSGIDGFTWRANDLDTLLLQMANGTAVLTDENRHLSNMMLGALDSGMSLGEALDFVNDVMNRGKDETEDLGEGYEDLGVSAEDAYGGVEGLAQAVADGELSMSEAEAIAGELGISVEELAGAYEELTAEVQTATEALQEHEAAQRAISDPVFKARRAIEKFNEAQGKVKELADEGKQGTEEFTEALIEEWEAAEDAEFALRGLTAAHDDGLTSYEQIQSRSDDLVESMGLSGEAAEIAREMFVELFEQAALLPDSHNIDLTVTDYASQTINDYITRLGNIPTHIQTQLRAEANIGGSLSGPQGGGGSSSSPPPVTNPSVRARGGSVHVGPSYLTGEEGPELITIGGHHGMVHDADSTNLMLSNPSMGALGSDGASLPRLSGGHADRSLVVSVPVHLDGRAIGESRVVLDAMSGKLKTIERDTAGLGPL